MRFDSINYHLLSLQVNVWKLCIMQKKSKILEQAQHMVNYFLCIFLFFLVTLLSLPIIHKLGLIKFADLFIEPHMLLLTHLAPEH